MQDDVYAISTERLISLAGEKSPAFLKDILMKRTLPVILGCMIIILISGCALRDNSNVGGDSDDPEGYSDGIRLFDIPGRNDADSSDNTDDEGLKENDDGAFRLPVSDENSVPHIKTDISGYDIQDGKIAYFEGDELSDYFYVTRSDDKSRVYEGRISDSGHLTKEGKKVWTGDFSDVTEEGVFYIETPVLGRSESFVIRKGINNEIKESLSEDLLNSAAFFSEQRGAQEEDFYINAEALLDLLAICELYPDEGRDKTQELLRICDELSEEYDSLIKEISEKAGGDSEAIIKARGVFITVLCQASATLYKDEADDHINRAVNEWQYLSGDMPESMPDKDVRRQTDIWRAAASAALCKVTGQLKYLDVSEEYVKNISHVTTDDFWPVYMYLTIPKITDVEVGMELMKKILNECAVICDDSESILYMPDEDNDPGPVQKRLYEARFLKLADCVLNSMEYRRKITSVCHELSIGEMLGKGKLSKEEKALLYLVLCESPE